MHQASITVRVWAHPWRDGLPEKAVRRELTKQPIQIGLSEGLIVGRTPKVREPFFRYLQPLPEDIGELSLDNIPARALVLQPMLLPGERIAVAATMNTSLGDFWRLHHDVRPIEQGTWRHIYAGDSVRLYSRANARQEWGIVLSALISKIASTSPAQETAVWLPSTGLPEKAKLARKLAPELHKDLFPHLFGEWSEWAVAIAVLCALVVDHQTDGLSARMKVAVRAAEETWSKESDAPYVSKYKGVSQFSYPRRAWSTLNGRFFRIVPTGTQSIYTFDELFGIAEPGGNDHDSRRIFVNELLKAGIVTPRELGWARRLISGRSPQ